jgi:hypothetical protein
MTKLETLLLEFYDKERSIIGVGNLKNLNEVKPLAEPGANRGRAPTTPTSTIDFVKYL